MQQCEAIREEVDIWLTDTFLANSVCVCRSGGHYWFSVWQTRLEEVSLSQTAPAAAPDPAATATSDASDIFDGNLNRSVGDGAGKTVSASTGDASLEFLRSRRTICMGKWEKICATGQGPFPRRHHSMTCLPDALCPASILSDDGPLSARVGVSSSPKAGGECDVTIRRVLFFGGQAEGIPFDASNDLYLLGIQHEREQLKRFVLRIPMLLPCIKQALEIGADIYFEYGYEKYKSWKDSRALDPSCRGW